MDAAVSCAGGLVVGAVVVSVTARLALECLQVTILADLLNSSHLHVTDEVSSGTRSLRVTLSLLHTLLLLTHEALLHSEESSRENSDTPHTYRAVCVQAALWLAAGV